MIVCSTVEALVGLYRICTGCVYKVAFDVFFENTATSASICVTIQVLLNADAAITSTSVPVWRIDSSGEVEENLKD